MSAQHTVNIIVDSRDKPNKNQKKLENITRQAVRLASLLALAIPQKHLAETISRMLSQAARDDKVLRAIGLFPEKSRSFVNAMDVSRQFINSVKAIEKKKPENIGSLIHELFAKAGGADDLELPERMVARDPWLL